jgi:hypothetical protein
MATLTNVLGTATALTMDVSSLAGDSNLLAGVESVEVAGADVVDYLINVDPITGHASTAPTVGQVIELYVWGADTSLATTAIDVLDGTSSAETLSHDAAKNSLRLAAVASVTVATAGKTYPIMPFTIAQFFGGVVPDFWGLFLTHNHTGALAASQSALFSYQTVTPTSTA